MPHPAVDPVPPLPGSQRPAVTVGVLLAIALAILVAGTLWLARANDGAVYYAELTEAPGLRVGGPVLYRGLHVGQIDDIAFTDTSVRITLRLGRDDVPIRQGAGVRLGRMGLLGDFDLELVPGAVPSAPTLPPGSTLARAAPDSARVGQEARAKAALDDITRDIQRRRAAPDSTVGDSARAGAHRDSPTRR